MQMRILQTVNSLTHTSIPVEMAYEMMKSEEVEIAALYNTQKEADQFASDMGIPGKIYGFGYRKNKIKGLYKYLGFLKKCSYDVIHTHHSLSGTLARLTCYGRIKLVHTVHANYHSYSKWQNLLIGATLNRTDAVVFNSHSSADGLYNWEKKRIRNVRQEVIYNGVNISKISKASDDFWKQFCSDNGIAEDDIIITQIGRLEPVKNPLGSLRGFLLLKNMVDPSIWDKLFFVYMGNGSEYSSMKKLVEMQHLEKKILLPGVINRESVYSWMKRADILIVPSFYEGFCNTLVEGMMAGMKICVADIPVFHEITDQELKLTQFNPKEDQAIASAMKYELERNELTGKACCEYANARFSLQKTIMSYLTLFKLLQD